MMLEDGGPKIIPVQMSIDFSGGDGFVTEHFLDST
jgi:hypothetical protein